MKRTVLARCLQVIEIFVFLLGVLFYAFLVPLTIKELAQHFPEFAYLVKPGIIAISLSAIPLGVALAAFWRICTNIARDRSFSRENVKLLMVIAACSLVDAAYCFFFTFYLSLKGAANPGVLLFSLGVILAGLAVAMIAFLLAYLINKAAVMEEEARYTV